MPTYQEVANRVLCLSGTAAALVAVECAIDFASYSKVEKFGGWLLSAYAAGLVACIVPCCGYVGAKSGDPGMLCFFSACNYCSCCVDCAVIGALLLMASQLYGARSLVRRCEPLAPHSQCDQEQRAQLVGACQWADAIFRNMTDADPNLTITFNTSQLSLLLTEQHCIDTLRDFVTIVLFLVVLALTLRSCATCCHLASGFYGSELYRMTKERDPFSDESGEGDCSE